MNSGNRLLWIVVGLLLTAAGVAGVLVNIGHLPGTDRSVPVISDGLIGRWRDWGGWAPTVVIAAGVVLALLGAALIRAELRRRGGSGLSTVVFPHRAEPAEAAGAGTLPLRDAAPPRPTRANRPSGGYIRVAGGTLRDALVRDLENDPRIRRAAVRLTGHPGTPRIRLLLDVPDGTEMTSVHEAVGAALARFRTTTHLDPLLDETIVRVA